MPNLSWEELRDLKHELQTARNEIIQSEIINWIPVYINTTIEKIDKLVLRHEEE